MQTPDLLSQASWIWPDNPFWDLHNLYCQLRKRFVLDAVPTTARLQITADQSYRLFVNGQFVCRGPARGFQSHWPYDELDIAAYLRPGENLIAIRAYNPGCSNFQYLSQGWAGVLFALELGEMVIVSDSSWKGRRQSELRRDTVPTSLQLFAQEHVDARLAPEGDWTAPEFEDSSWGGVSTTVWNAMPWYSLEPRGIPLLREGIATPTALVGTATGKCAPGYRTTRDLCRTRYDEGLAHTATEGDPTVLEIPATGFGRWRSYLLDFGKTVVGNPMLTVENAAAGTLIDTLHIETLDPETLTPDFIPDAGCKMAFGVRLACHDGANHHTFYHIFGFRYVVITVRDAPRALRLKLTVQTSLYPLERTGRFEHTDPTLTAIWETSAWTQQVCMLDAYVDTPWREQAQWWGDARVQAWNTFHLSGDSRLFRRGIAQIAGQQLANGLTYGHAPTMAHNCILPDFTLTWMLTLWDHYWQTGALDAFESHRETLEKALAYFLERRDKKCGLVGYDNRYWLFLDWTGIFRDGYPAVYNLWLLEALEKMTVLYALSGRKKRATALEADAKALRKALKKLIGENGLVHDGLTFERKLVESTSVHTQTLALMTGLVGKAEAPLLDNVLLPFIRRELVPEVHPSAYWITYVFTELAERGFGAEVLSYIKARWEPMVAHGTTWENFAPVRCHESFSHAWSAHPLYHTMQILGGVRQTQSGWGEVWFQPTYQGERCRCVYPTPHGEIISAWEKQGSQIAIALELPAGVTAIASLAPGLDRMRVTGRREWKLPLPVF